MVAIIDASVGSLDHVGYATLGRGALQPGLGVSKELQAVGDIAITGIVGGVGSGSGCDPERTPVHDEKWRTVFAKAFFLVERLWENAAII